MKAWVVGAGTDYRAGGVAYRSWSASGGTTVSYTLGSWDSQNMQVDRSTLTYDGTEISAGNGNDNVPFSGGDGGAEGGFWASAAGSGDYYGGAIGGNAAGQAACGRTIATDVSGLLAAVALAGGKVTEDCGEAAAFGSGGYLDYYGSYPKSAGIGGGLAYYASGGGESAVVLLFT
jgi:hypothetical protein